MKRYYFMLFMIAIAFSLASCSQGHKGDKGENGDTVVGPAGPQGDPGQDGRDGAVGPAGADGRIATVVPLCPGVSSYPGVFVEVALLINGSLYAVYSANDGFLTLIPPGDYHSNAIGSACNFHVNADATVTTL